MILAAGLGTRLQPLTADRAKPAIPVVDASLIEHIVRYLHRFGIDDIAVNLHHQPESITRVLGDGRDLGVRITYSHEERILGTAGGPRKILDYFEARAFVLMNGDTLTDVDLREMARVHAARQALVTLALSPELNASHYGGVEVGADGRVTRFVPAGSPAAPGACHFVGVQIAEPAVFARIPDGAAAETIMQVYPALMREPSPRSPVPVAAFVTGAAFFDFGSPRTYLESCLALLRARALPGNVLAAAGSEIRPGAQVREAVIGRRCCIESGARIEESVLWDDIVVPSGAILTRCVVGDGVILTFPRTLTDAVLVRPPVGSAPEIVPLA